MVSVSPRQKRKKKKGVRRTQYHRNSDRGVDRHGTNVVAADVVAASYGQPCAELADETLPVVRNCSTGYNQPTGTERLETAAEALANRSAVLPAPAGIRAVRGHRFPPLLDGLDSRDWTLRDDRPPRSGKWHAGGAYCRHHSSVDYWPVDRRLPFDAVPQRQFHSHWPTHVRCPDLFFAFFACGERCCCCCYCHYYYDDIGKRSKFLVAAFHHAFNDSFRGRKFKLKYNKTPFFSF